MNERGISLVTLIITIIIIILLTTVGGYYTIDALKKTERMDTEEEFRNVEELISIQRARIQNDEYVVSEDYVASDAEIDEKFGTLLGSEMITLIKETNNSESIPPEYKYHLMNQEKFDTEFSEHVNVRYVKREYLINYGKGVVIANSNGKAHISGKIEVNDNLGENEIKVKFSPNGNTEWSKSQTTEVTVESGSSLVTMKYEWLQTKNEPEADAITHTFFSGQEITKSGVTGNDYYLWVYVENANGYSVIERSDAFYIDNTKPEGELSVE